MKQKRPWSSLIFFIILCLVVEVVSGYWTSQTVSTWYPQLVKPIWTPPGWVFGPVWSILYIMIAVSGWLIYQSEHSSNRSMALIFYFGQLALNFAWSFLFFFLRSPLLGMIDIVALCLCVLLTIKYAWAVHLLASLLLIPYLIWGLYATSLNIGIWLLND